MKKARKSSPLWGEESRFYLPNEDGQMVRTALSILVRKPSRPVFVGGSGMVLLDAVADLSDLQRATFVDISEFQVAYFKSLLIGVKDSQGSADLLAWFSEIVFPQLHYHYFAGRNQEYPLERVLVALRDLFRIRYFFEPEAFTAVKGTLTRITAVERDIVSYLAETRERHDFVYLSNVPDYLPDHRLPVLFGACARQSAPVYLLLTEACKDPCRVRQAWEAVGYIEHPASARLTEQNCGLGSFSLKRPWNRKGRIALLVPEGAFA